MKTLLLLISTRFLKLVKLFAHTNQTSERKLFGLGQFIVLLTLAPFIFNLTLYSFGKNVQIPSHYEYDADRFNPMYKILNRNEIILLKQCSQESYSNTRTPFAIVCNALRKKANDEMAAKYTAFNINQAKPEPQPAIVIKQYTNNSISNRMGGEPTINAWQQVTLPAWLLGGILIIPAMLLCFRRRCWGLLAFGLAIPAYNYIVTISAFIFDWSTLSNWLVTSTIVPQIAFCWFALRGQIRSKSFVYFIAFMVACTLLPSITENTQEFSVMKAQLPLLVFIVVAAIARLIVKGARENGYLLKNLGWSRSLKTGLHSLGLWLPMAVLALPFLYLTQVVIPQHWVNNLHDKGVLVFDHTHDILDNALQSTALKTDDVIYAWHMQTQAIKKDIYDKKTKLNQTDIEQSVQNKFDEIVPKDLEFEEHESDAFLVGFIVDLSVKASQTSTNNAYKTFRKSIKDGLKDTVAENETLLKDSVDNNVSKAFELIDAKYEQGKYAILQANQDTQASLWWTINYLRAAHQLALLFFAFVCIKSFMYVFARVSFNRDTGTFVTLGDTKEAAISHPQSRIKSTGKAYLIGGDTDETFYISRKFQCLGRAPKLSIPQLFHAPIARLFNGAYTMNKIVMQTNDDQVSCSTTKGMEFFEWTLADGEIVILDFHYFVGISKDIKIATLISPRMSSLLLGKMIFSQAAGPGKLILMAEGQAEIIGENDKTGSFPPERLIAMHKNTRLHIDSELDPLNVYLSTAYIRPAGGGKMIVDVDSQRGAKTGLASFIKHFILPF